MRSIGKLNTAPEASTFGDYLYSKGIENQIEEESDGTCSVWVLDEDRMAEAGELLKQYIANPNADELRKVSKIAEKKRADEEKAASRKRSVVATEERVRYERTLRPPAPVTTALIGLSVVTTLLMQSWAPLDITWYFYFIPSHIFQGEVWRLITPIFLHFGTLHLVFNMFWLYDLGGMIEQRLGKRFLILFVVITAIATNWAECGWEYFRGDEMGGVYGFGGMSGVVYAMFGFVWIRSKDRGPIFSIQQGAATTMIIWLFLCMTGWIGHIANAAHVAGILSGMAWGFITRNRFRN